MYGFNILCEISKSTFKIKSVRYGSNWQSLFPIHAPSDQEPMAEKVPEGDWVHCWTYSLNLLK